MELKDRIRIIIDELNIKQKDFAKAIKVTESYVSNMLSGKRKSISEPLAYLIEEKYKYSAEWIQTGNGNKYINFKHNTTLSPEKMKLISALENMSEDEVLAVIAFMQSLDNIKKNVKK